MATSRQTKSLALLEWGRDGGGEMMSDFFFLFFFLGFSAQPSHAFAALSLSLIPACYLCFLSAPLSASAFPNPVLSLRLNFCLYPSVSRMRGEKQPGSTGEKKGWQCDRRKRRNGCRRRLWERLEGEDRRRRRGGRQRGDRGMAGAGEEDLGSHKYESQICKWHGTQLALNFLIPVIFFYPLQTPNVNLHTCSERIYKLVTPQVRTHMLCEIFSKWGLNHTSSSLQSAALWSP